VSFCTVFVFLCGPDCGSVWDGAVDSAIGGRLVFVHWNSPDCGIKKFGDRPITQGLTFIYLTIGSL